MSADNNAPTDITDLAATRRLAAFFADAGRLRGKVIYLHGELGAGKTTWVRFLLQALGEDGPVRSPGYGLLESYALPGLKVLHLDLYRLRDPEELEFLGLRDLLDEDSVLLVEWPEHGAGHLPPPDWRLRLRFEKQGRRTATIEARGNAGESFARLRGS